jgi:hypothetical protein
MIAQSYLQVKGWETALVDGSGDIPWFDAI